MNRSPIVITFLLAVVFLIGLYAYGYKQGKDMGFSGSSEVAAGLVALSMNPVSQSGFKLGYHAGRERIKELKEWRQDRFGPWMAWSSKDPMTDFNNTYLRNEGDVGPYGKKSAILFRCLNNKTEVLVDWGAYLVGDRGNRIQVTYRVDSNKPVVTKWLLSTDKKSFFYNGSSIGFIRSLVGAEKLVVQFEEDSLRTISFNLSRLEERVVPLTEACQWSL